MEIWGLEAYFLEDIPSAEVARSVYGNVSSILGKRGLVKEVGVSIITHTTYFVYVQFDWPPDSIYAIEALQRAFDGFKVLRCDLMNPFSVQGKPVESVDMSRSEVALAQIKQNQQMFKQLATSGRDFALYRGEI